MYRRAYRRVSETYREFCRYFQPGYIALQHLRKQKEVKRDSRKKAKALRNGELQGIYIPTVTSMEFRVLVRFQKILVKQANRNKTR